MISSQSLRLLLVTEAHPGERKVWPAVQKHLSDFQISFETHEKSLDLKKAPLSIPIKCSFVFASTPTRFQQYQQSKSRYNLPSSMCFSSVEKLPPFLLCRESCLGHQGLMQKPRAAYLNKMVSIERVAGWMKKHLLLILKQRFGCDKRQAVI